MFCENKWHETQDTDYCTSCGVRKDGVVTLANIPFGCLANAVLAKKGDGKSLWLRFLSTNAIGSDFAVGNDGANINIPMNELHDWVVVRWDHINI